MAAMQFELVAPERAMASGEADQVTAPGVDGDLTALPGHAPFLTTLRPGVVTAQMGGSEHHYAVFGGFVEIAPDRVTVLAEEAQPLDEMTVETLEQRVAHAQEALGNAEGDDVARLAQVVNDLLALKDRQAS